MKFIADKTVGKLIKWLRILGYDTVFWRSYDIEGLLREAQQEGRIIITKDSKLYRNRGAVEALLILEDNPFLQLTGVVRHFRLLIDEKQLFSRCLVCNSLLEEVDPGSVKDEVPEYVFHSQQEFSRCPSCHKVYWPGTHYNHMLTLVERLKDPGP